MAVLDWSQCEAVESVPGKVSGAWVFKDTRLPVATVIENLECSSVDDIVEQFHVSREQITAVLEFVARSLEAASGKALVEAMQNSPHREIELEPERYPMPVAAALEFAARSPSAPAANT